MRIECPYCGSRYASEFTYLGDAAVKRPADDDKDQNHWFSYIFHRRNPKGWHSERWQHTGGCRSILEVERNTVTHAIRSAKVTGVWSEEKLSGQQKTSSSAEKTAAAGKNSATASDKSADAETSSADKEQEGET